MAKSCPSSEIAGSVPVDGISRRCECIVNMKAIAPDADSVLLYSCFRAIDSPNSETSCRTKKEVRVKSWVEMEMVSSLDSD